MAETLRATGASWGAAVATLLALAWSAPVASAHRLDEYLQATLVVIEPARISLQINCTPGVSVVEQLLGLIDRDQDGDVCEQERVEYAGLFLRSLRIRLDQQELPLHAARCSFPGVAEMRAGTGIITMEFTADLKELANGPHVLSIENKHLPAIGVYLVNAAKPASPQVKITAQKRNDTQSTGEIAFTYRAADLNAP